MTAVAPAGGRRRPRRFGRLGPAAGALTGSLASIVLAIVAASIVLQFSGFGLSSLTTSLFSAVGPNIGDTISWTTPLILTGLGTVVVFRARIWNIGLDGQLYVGALFSVVVARWVAHSLNPNVGVVVVLAGSILAGAVFAGIPALLRILWGAPEIVTTVILISVGQLLASWAVRGPLKSADPAVAASLTTDPVDHSLWLVQLTPGSQATVGIYLALLAAAAMALYLRKTRWGYEHRLYGANAGFSHYAGIDNRKVFAQTMLISGGLGGLAGGIEVLGVFHNLTDGFDPSLGFTGIAVALVANLNAVAVVFAAFFFGALQVAGTHLQLATSAPSQFVDIVTGVVILMMTGRVVDRWFTTLRRRRAARSDRPAPVGGAERATGDDAAGR